MVMAEYIKGEVIKSLDELVSQKHVFFNSELLDETQISHWTIFGACNSIGFGKLFLATEKKKTIMDDFFKKYPKAPRTEDGVPEPCPKQIYHVAETCGHFTDCIACWSRPIPDEDTTT